MIKRINEAKPIPSFYYALSHVWRLTEDNRYHWNDVSEYVDDEQGQPVNPVSMRHEKRDTLLAMLRNHPDSYWWIDVLCARSDTPLDIMGDIYACCLECVAMVDCEPSLIRSLCDGEIAAAKIPYVPSEPLPSYTEICRTKAPQLIELLYRFLQCGWWQRVWTWQEMVLPVGPVRLMAETETHQLSQRNTITVDELCEYVTTAIIIETSLNELYNSSGSYGDICTSEVMRTSAVLRDLHDITTARRSSSHRISGSKDTFIYYILDSLSESTRRCYDPVDYVYGVLGALQIKIPRVADPNVAWRHLSLKLDYYSEKGEVYSRKCIDRAHEVDLLKAETIGAVYKNLKAIFYEFS